MSSGENCETLCHCFGNTDDCVLNMCMSVYISFPLESVTLAGGRGLVLGGLRLTPQGLQGYSATALCQILRLSHSWLLVKV